MIVPNEETVIADAFPDEPSETLIRRRGQFHDVIVGADRVVTIARTEAASTRLPQRATTLNTIATLLPEVCIPKVISLHPTYIVMTRVPGEPLDQRSGSATILPLRNLLQAFMNVDSSVLAEENLTTLSPDRWIHFSRNVKNDLFPMMSDAGRERAITELDAAVSLPPMASHLVHGDLGGDNLLWKFENGKLDLAGVLDWDGAHIGDVATDLAALHATFGEDIVRKIVSNLGMPDDILSRVDAIRGTFALQQALAGLQDGDDAEMMDGIREYI